MQIRFVGAAILALSISAHSALTAVDLDGIATNGHEGVYDDVLDITWLADANYAQTSGFDVDGRITWTAAEAFIADLNTNRYLNITSWRQASASPEGCRGYQCGNQTTYTEDELGYHYYQNLGAIDNGGMTNGSNTAYLNLFTNIQDNLYWTGTEVSPGSSSAFIFLTTIGFQTTNGKISDRYVWVVAPGNVAANAVPVPAAVWLFGSALIGLAGLARQR